MKSSGCTNSTFACVLALIYYLWDLWRNYFPFCDVPPAKGEYADKWMTGRIAHDLVEFRAVAVRQGTERWYPVREIAGRLGASANSR